LTYRKARSKFVINKQKQRLNQYLELVKAIFVYMDDFLTIASLY